MCGRYALYDTAKSDLEMGHNLVGKNYNIAPLAMVPVIKDNNNIELVRWAFKVAWDTKLNIINARSETLASKLAFQNTKRCIFIANGYFEWLSRDKSKIPYYHTFNDKLMYFGGILNDQGACIVTRESYPLKVKVHSRQPVLLQCKDFRRWFTSEHDYSCGFSRDMDVYQVTSLVNSSKNNSPGIIKRA